jgi:hypothetical protein
MLSLHDPFTWALICVLAAIAIILSKRLPPPSHGVPV